MEGWVGACQACTGMESAYEGARIYCVNLQDVLNAKGGYSK